MKNISILGSTGSIGTQALEIVRAHLDELKVVAISGNTNIELLMDQIEEFSPGLVCVYDEANAAKLLAMLSASEAAAEGTVPEIVSGMEGLIRVATHPTCEMVLTAVVGMVGIRPTYEAVCAGKDIALANKETLVCAGSIIMEQARKTGVNIYPVDSEHSAVFQAMQGQPEKRLEKLILTASGGPFRGYTRDMLKKVRIEDAMKHPNWNMGLKVTIDSSTLANKGLEVIEAGWLFNVPSSKIQVVVHPQSIIHSAVQFEDGAIMAQLGTPDMKLPIQYAFFYPDRPFLGGERVDLIDLGSLTFEKPDTDNFPALALAYEAMEEGGTMPCVFNAANERAVADFVNGKISYDHIPQFIEEKMNAHKTVKAPSLDEIIKTGEDIIFG
ncbi:MAG: 1-deoxy-D-xylulose-5-phosphate reductoisomerase [Lachnospiraceae bacterium]|jgi:1-deoxy-D-xylulose-5-phosphate reductoisomerase